MRLSKREAEVTLLVAGGYTVKEAARALGIARATAARYLASVYTKLGVHNRRAFRAALREREQA